MKNEKKEIPDKMLDKVVGGVKTKPDKKQEKPKASQISATKMRW